MPINYLENNKIQIKDDIKSHNFMLKISLWLNFISMGLIILNNYSKDEFLLFLSALIIFLINFIALLYYYFKVDANDVYHSKEIKSLKIRNVFGNKRYSLNLINGKYRHLPFLNEMMKVEKLESFIKQHN